MSSVSMHHAHVAGVWPYAGVSANWNAPKAFCAVDAAWDDSIAKLESVYGSYSSSTQAILVAAHKSEWCTMVLEARCERRNTAALQTRQRYGMGIAFCTATIQARRSRKIEDLWQRDARPRLIPSWRLTIAPRHRGLGHLNGTACELERDLGSLWPAKPAKLKLRGAH